jgi:zinc protease
MPTDKSWADTDYKLAYEKYKERFANAADFEFYFVGNVDDAIEDYYEIQLHYQPMIKRKK